MEPRSRVLDVSSRADADAYGGAHFSGAISSDARGTNPPWPVRLDALIAIVDMVSSVILVVCLAQLLHWAWAMCIAVITLLWLRLYSLIGTLYPHPELMSLCLLYLPWVLMPCFMDIMGRAAGSTVEALYDISSQAGSNPQTALASTPNRPTLRGDRDLLSLPAPQALPSTDTTMLLLPAPPGVNSSSWRGRQQTPWRTAERLERASGATQKLALRASLLRWVSLHPAAHSRQ